MALEVYLPHGRPELVRGLREAVEPAVTLHVGEERPDAYEVLVCGRPERDDLTASPDLRALVVPWAGVPPQTRELLLEFPRISVHNLHHNAAPTAELAVSLLMAAAKAIVPLDRALRSGDWRPRYEEPRSVLLAGKTALVLGYGAIGRHVAAACRGLGMKVLAIRRTPARDDLAEVHAPDELHELLPRADAILVCLPLTEETDGLIGANELALLPPDAILVNIGRGPIVDEDALHAALAERRLGAAGLDVWYAYPRDEESRVGTAPSKHPFGDLDNVVLSPHRGGLCKETEALRAAALAEALLAAARGDEIPGRVDLEAGY